MLNYQRVFAGNQFHGWLEIPHGWFDDAPSISPANQTSMFFMTPKDITSLHDIILLCTDLKTGPCTCFWTWTNSHWWLSVFWTCSIFSVFSHLCFPIFVFVVCLHAFSSRTHISMLTCQCKKAFKHLPRFRSCHVHRGECGREPGVDKKHDATLKLS